MKKILIGLIFLVLSLFLPKTINADDTWCGDMGINVTMNGKSLNTDPGVSPFIYSQTEKEIVFNISGSGLVSGKDYWLFINTVGGITSHKFTYYGNSTITVNNSSALNIFGSVDQVHVWVNIFADNIAGVGINKQCFAGEYLIKPKRELKDGCDIEINNELSKCDKATGRIKLTFDISNMVLDGEIFNGDTSVKVGFMNIMKVYAIDGGASVSFGEINPGTYKIVVRSYDSAAKIGERDIVISPNCNSIPPKIIGGSSSESGTTLVNPEECDGGKGLITALGCIPTQPQALVGWILKYAISIGGGVAFLLMVFAGFLLSTSAGNPERVKQGQEMLTSAIVGLLFIIFSVFLLQFIGVDILKIPGFGN